MLKKSLILFCGALWLSMAVSEPAVEDIDAKFNAEVKMRTTQEIAGKMKWCIVKPPGHEAFYEVHPAFNLSDPNVYHDQGSITPCDVAIRKMSEAYVGEWRLEGESESKITNATYHVRIKDTCDPLPKSHVTMLKYQSLTIGLSKSLRFGNASTYINCTTSSPHGNTSVYESDPSGRCMFLVRDAAKNKTDGKWTVVGVAGDVQLTTDVNIEVSEYPEHKVEVELLSGAPAELTFGPNDTLYCEYTAPRSQLKVRQLGKCTVRISSVSKTLHDGDWVVDVGVESSMSRLYFVYSVKVKEIDGQRSGIVPYASLYNTSEGNRILDMSCILAVKSMSSCRFVRNDGAPYFINQNLGVDRYEHFVREQQHSDYVECGIRIRSPDALETKPWKCFIVSEDTEFASWVQTDDYIDDQATDKFIQVDTNVTAVKDHSTTLLCEYAKPISYCWFTFPNRTRHAILQTTNTATYEYHGSGFQTGHCGIRIKSSHAFDAGSWRCNVGKMHGDPVDTQATINVSVLNSPLVPILREQLWQRGVNLTCKTYDDSPLEYCRFVRPDGRGINPASIRGLQHDFYPSNGTDLDKGVCRISLRSNFVADIGTWTCVAKPLDEDVEYSTELYIYTYYYFHTNNGAGLDIFLWIIIIFGITGTICLMRLLYVRYHELNGRSSNSDDHLDTISTMSDPPQYAVALSSENRAEKQPLP